MLLKITTTMQPASDLGYLMAKHPAKTHTWDEGVGTLTIWYPEVSDRRCTMAMHLAVDPVRIVRGPGFGSIEEYVNDRPYVASSLLSTAIAQRLKSALQGQSKDRPELARTKVPLACTVSVLPCRGRDTLLADLFEPLGWKVTTLRHHVDHHFPDWGESLYHTLVLEGEATVQSLLQHLYILVPVLDKDKHYYAAGREEAAKLEKHASLWLPQHPLRELIANRYLGYDRRALAAKVLGSMDERAAETAGGQGGEPDAGALDLASEPAGASAISPVSCDDVTVEPSAPLGTITAVSETEDGECKLNLHKMRHQAVAEALHAAKARTVLDAGCGSGKLVEALAADEAFTRIVGIDPSVKALEKASFWMRRNLIEGQRRKVELLQGSVTYRDPRLAGMDAAVLVEVIEHIDLDRLPLLEESIFGSARPRTVVVTTPNIEYNVLFPTLEAGTLRHRDHRFEWTRSEFQSWAQGVASRYGYSVSFRGVGPEDTTHGCPSQMAVFALDESQPAPAPLVEIACNPIAAEPEVTVGLLEKPVFIRPEQKFAAMEAVSRFAVDPRAMVYLPPTMSPCDTGVGNPDLLEHPAAALEYYRRYGVKQVVCEEKHMGSRAVVVVAACESAFRDRFGFPCPAAGVVYTRKGNRFFDDSATEHAFLEEVRSAMKAAGFFQEFGDWAVLDCELMPWSAKAQGLLRGHFAPAGAAGQAALSDVVESLEAACDAGVEVTQTLAFARERLDCVRRYREAYRRYCWPVRSIADYRLAPFHLLATEGRVHIDMPHTWHMETLARVARASGSGVVMATPYRLVNVDDEASRDSVIRWWEELTAAGGEGMVVKPLDFIARDERGLVQPAIKVRGREYLRIIYGAEYTMPENMNRLRERNTRTKRALALREFALGVESLQRFVQRRPLQEVHEAAFAVLALELEPVDPRL